MMCCALGNGMPYAERGMCAPDGGRLCEVRYDLSGPLPIGAATNGLARWRKSATNPMRAIEPRATPFHRRPLHQFR